MLIILQTFQTHFSSTRFDETLCLIQDLIVNVPVKNQKNNRDIFKLDNKMEIQ